MEKFKNSDNLYGILPVPVWYQILTSEELGEDLTKFNDKLKDIANEYYQKWQIEVPDERHLCKSMTKDYISSFVQRKTFTQQYNPAIGKWHAVPTNNFLSIDELEVKKLKGIIVNSYTQALDTFYNSQKMFELDYNFKEAKKDKSPTITESWIQFYQNGDYKVLHNHLRYGFDPSHEYTWAGGYYIQDGKPDPYQPYAGRFSFRIREFNHFIKPVPGLIMLWPADILHEVHPFYGEEERVCINFNLSMKNK
tara:strand:+ start:1037 stop:1789 length:753 start_codon:yes stop_codon:yes gene_type:complete